MKKIINAMVLGATVLSGSAYAETTLNLVEVITSPKRTELLKKQVAAFEAANPDTKVEITSLPWGQAFEKLATMVSSGQAPDVVEMPDKWLGVYGNANQLENLEGYYKGWDHAATLSDKAQDMGRLVGGDLYQIPYGFYLRAMFYNKTLFKQAGIEQTPHTIEEFKDAARKVSELDGKYGYCLRGSKGGHGGWLMFSSIMNGSADFFDSNGKSTIDSEGSKKGLSLLVDIYKNGWAPKDSVNWGFNEIVAGFYSNTCAMLDQDPDALIAIADKMSPEEFGVIPMPVGPSGKSYPVIGFAGWSMFSSSEHKDESWKLISHLTKPESNVDWAQFVGVIPVHKGAEKDQHFSGEQFSGWFEELNKPEYEPLVFPHHLKQFGYFADVKLIEGGQELLLGTRSVDDVAAEWSEYLTDAQTEWLENKK
ncbi:sugar ABC transporter substrate-binding protein [Kiloniella sp. EL199]|uniref:ABC transporter substrate-binding protein n=1 Tax=Kiloniella sp. EL199 TaxID=2107581 RepID=UPI000EA24189|nr:sugar ABC transporter substrate-binding protein [Kiloniella sp. EL199]